MYVHSVLSYDQKVRRANIDDQTGVVVKPNYFSFVTLIQKSTILSLRRKPGTGSHEHASKSYHQNQRVSQ